jgi:hypothetical protein
MNVGLGKAQDKAKLAEGFIETEEFEVVAVEGGEILGGVFESEAKDRDFGAFDVVGKAGVGAFGFNAAFFAGDDLGGILDAVEDAVPHLLGDIVDGDGSARVVEVTAAAVAGGGRKEGSVGGLETEAEEAEFLDQGNEGMEDFLVAAVSEAAAEVGEGGAAGDGDVEDSGQAPVGLTSFGIAQYGAEVLDVGDSVKIAGKVEDKEGNGIIARGAEDGVGIGGDGANERKVNKRTDQLRESALNGTVIVDVNLLGTEMIMGEPTGFFPGKGLGVGPVDGGIDFLELYDYILNRELGEINHLKNSRVSREVLRPSKTLAGNPFLLSNFLHPTLPKNSELHQISSRWTKIGGVALRSFSRA